MCVCVCVCVCVSGGGGVWEGNHVCVRECVHARMYVCRREGEGEVNFHYQWEGDGGEGYHTLHSMHTLYSKHALYSRYVCTKANSQRGIALYQGRDIIPSHGLTLLPSMCPHSVSMYRTWQSHQTSIYGRSALTGTRKDTSGTCMRTQASHTHTHTHDCYSIARPLYIQTRCRLTIATGYNRTRQTCV